VTHEDSNNSKKRAAPPADPLNAQLATLATRQHGVVTTAQLRELGLGGASIAHRAKTGRLHPIHRGVYALGHPRLNERGLWMAAVLAAGKGAVLSSLSAAALWRISRWTTDDIFVLVPGHKRRRNDFRLQTCRHLDPLDVTRQHGIAVTTVPRTLVDLTDILTAAQLANVIHEAAFRKRFDERATRTAMARANGRANLARLDEALELNARGSAGTKSELEDRFLAQAREAGLPEPEINVEIEGLEVDFRFGHQIVEVDGHGHERPRTRAEDEQRDATLRAAGYDVARVAADDLDSAFQPALLDARG
jgi:very-short-patch-repair endonuclease